MVLPFDWVYLDITSHDWGLNGALRLAFAIFVARELLRGKNETLV